MPWLSFLRLGIRNAYHVRRADDGGTRRLPAVRARRRHADRKLRHRGAGQLLTLVGIAGVIVAYIKRSDARNVARIAHDLADRTFWWSTLWALIGWAVLVLFAIVLIGLALGPLIWAVVAIWVAYRVIKGVMYFKDQRPLPL